MRRRYKGAIEVSVDLDDVFDEISDEQLIEEVEDRRLSIGSGFDRDYAERALQALATRRFADAEALLERALRPFPETPKEAHTLMQSLFEKPKHSDDRTNAREGTPSA